MAIVIVAGPSCAGKSHFIKEYFPRHRVIDLFEFQRDITISIPAVMKSYEQCRDALVEAVQHHENVVLEHTLLKAIRRKMYIDAIKEVTDEPIEIYFLFPCMTKHMEYAQQRDAGWTANELQNMRDIAEFPTVEEGFHAVHIIEDTEVWK